MSARVVIDNFISICRQNHLSFTVYRLPRQEKFYLLADTKENRIHIHQHASLHNGFIFQPFNSSESALWLNAVFFADTYNFNPEKLIAIGKGINKEREDKPILSISKENYLARILEIKKNISQGKISKLVFSRNKSVSRQLNISDALHQLSLTYPEAFVHYTSAAYTGNWLAATPEILVRKQEDALETMSLAGTIKSDADAEQILWEKKELEEQKIVTDYICHLLHENGYTFEISPRFTLKTGKLNHICNKIRMSGKDDDLLRLASVLHPTPAVCGFPKEEAFRLIQSLEGYSRSFYTGFIGPVNTEKALFVHLRCAKIDAEKIILFAGGGITSGSDPEKEWLETENKMQNLLNCL